MKKYTIILFLIVFSMMLVLAGCGGNDEPEVDEEPIEEANGEEVVEEQAEEGLIDGEYIGYSDYDGRGYGKAIVIIENGQISDVTLAETDEIGEEKDFSNYPHEAAVEAIEELPVRFIEANSAEVDDYTGATGSSKKLKQAVERALVKAGQDDGGSGDYFDGVFLGRSEEDERGYGYAVVTISNDEIVDIELNEVDNDGNVRDYEEYDYDDVIAAREEMREDMISANSYEVDEYTGATSSSKRFKNSVKNALEKAQR